MVTLTALKPSLPQQLPSPNGNFAEQTTMTWNMPRIVEIAVGLEINAYACAALN